MQHPDSVGALGDIIEYMPKLSAVMGLKLPVQDEANQLARCLQPKSGVFHLLMFFILNNIIYYDSKI